MNCATQGPTTNRHSASNARISAIVPVHNGGAQLLRCLTHLQASTRLPDEIIVVDDASTDDSAEIGKRFQVHVTSLQNGPHGPAYARNRGAALACGEILLFIDADVAVHADTVARVDATFATNPAVQALFGSYDDCPPAPEITSRFKNLLHHYIHQHSSREARTFWSGCGAIRREVFLTSGGFAEVYRKPSIEDIELGLRLCRARRTIRLCPEIQVTHLKCWTLRELWSTDIVARAIPWTRMILNEGHLRADLNLTWCSRVSACANWVFVLLSAASLAQIGRGDIESAQWDIAAAFASLAIAATLNAKLYRFFFKHGGIAFAVCAWMLHLVYLLYSSAIFTVLMAECAYRRAVQRQRVRPPQSRNAACSAHPLDVART